MRHGDPPPAQSAKAYRIAAKLAAEWRATEAAVAELEKEIPYPLTQVVADLEKLIAVATPDLRRLPVRQELQLAAAG